jgi:hypothetical protein
VTQLQEDIVTTATGLRVGDYPVHRGRTVYLECSRGDHVRSFRRLEGEPWRSGARLSSTRQATAQLTERRALPYGR